MLYYSTRSSNKKVTSSEAIINGIAEDGGLYVPEYLPKIENLKELLDLNYKQLACVVLNKFFTDFTKEEIKECVYNAYNEKFRSNEIAPLKKCEDMYFLELFHGATLAFKDMALSILPHLMTTAVKKHKLEKEVVILTATSGDTGKAALEGFKDVEGIKIIVFFPRDGVSDVQKMQMITQAGNNTHVVMLEGNFDDAQNGVKEIFVDKELKDQLLEKNIILSSANSINIGRLVPQIVYYIYAYMNLVRNKEIELNEEINIGVPTGNFGNILAAYYAKQMGLPINKLICASNENNILTDFINTGVYDINRKFKTTSSPSMDILISSNLERLLYEITTKDSDVVTSYMNSLKNKSAYKINEKQILNMRDFYGDYAKEIDVTNAIKEVYEKYNYVIDTHTAVAYHVCKNYKNISKDNKKIVIASTASPFKFAGSVYRALNKCNYEYNDFEFINKLSEDFDIDIPSPIKDIDKLEVVHQQVCSKDTMKETVCRILKA